jgi:pilus assembly protein Flp/PilA
MLSIYFWVMQRIQVLRNHSERGAAAVEYGLLVGLIAVAIIAAVTILGTKLNSTFCHVVAELPFTTETCAP